MSEEKKNQDPDSNRPLSEEIIEGYERMGPKDKFNFECRPGVSCFNKCCGDVNIFLSPYDVLRLKTRLGMESSEFLDKHAILPVQKEMRTPVVVLRMNDDEHKTCPFLTDEGCGVYSDRPWPCRMYPVGLAASKDTPDGFQGERFYFLMQEECCQGGKATKEWTVDEWTEDQGVGEYDKWGEAYKELTLHEFFETGGSLPPERMHMMFTACYELDKFREFVFKSTLLERFEVDEDMIDEMGYSDEALLRFAFLWLRYSLFGEPTVRVREKALEDLKGKVARREKELLDKKQDKRPGEGTE